jgi:hypothetical protein
MIEFFEESLTSFDERSTTSTRNFFKEETSDHFFSQDQSKKLRRIELSGLRLWVGGCPNHSID